MTEYTNQHPLAEAFRAAVTTRDGEFAVAVAVSRFVGAGEDPEALFSATISPLLQLPSASVSEIVGWFRAQGFVGPQGQVTTAHSDVNFVLEYRQGIPITLAVLLLEATRRLELSGFGINFPGHFLLNLEGFVVDPLGMAIVGDAELERLNSQVSGNQRDLLQPASVQMVGLRMLNNLKAQYVNQQDFAKALEVIDLQLACSLDDAELVSSLHFERGEYWQRLGLNSAARDAYLLCARHCPYPQLAQKAQEKADDLADGPETLH